MNLTVTPVPREKTGWSLAGLFDVTLNGVTHQRQRTLRRHPDGVWRWGWEKP